MLKLIQILCMLVILNSVQLQRFPLWNEEHCYSCNDPHMRSIDGRYYEFQYEGNFLMYVDQSQATKVWGGYVKCNRRPGSSGPTCNCGVRLVADGAIISYDKCGIATSGRIFYKNTGSNRTIAACETKLVPATQEVNDAWWNTPGNALALDDKFYCARSQSSSNTYFLRTNRPNNGDNVYVKFDINSYSINCIKIKPAPNHKFNTNGLCGIWDDNQNNDITLNPDFATTTDFPNDPTIPYSDSTNHRSGTPANPRQTHPSTDNPDHPPTNNPTDDGNPTFPGNPTDDSTFPGIKRAVFKRDIDLNDPQEAGAFIDSWKQSDTTDGPLGLDADLECSCMDGDGKCVPLSICSAQGADDAYVEQDSSRANEVEPATEEEAIALCNDRLGTGGVANLVNASIIDQAQVNISFIDCVKDLMAGNDPFWSIQHAEINVQDGTRAVEELLENDPGNAAFLEVQEEISAPIEDRYENYEEINNAGAAVINGCHA